MKRNVVRQGVWGFGSGRSAAASVAAVVGIGVAVGVVRGSGGGGPETEIPSPLGIGERLEVLLPPVAAAPRTGAAPAFDFPNLDHPRVDHFVRVFTGPRRAEFARYLARKGEYQPMISAKLAERGMPQDLIYLAMIESGFNPRAYSRAHASGIWQFIPGTGRGFGLEQNAAVDERRDPEKSTDAALRYLQQLHDQFGSWYLAAAAYNGGSGRVSRIMRQATGTVRGDDRAYYRIGARLPRETRDYVPLIVAAMRIAKEPERYGFGDVVPAAPLAYDTVEVAPATQLAAIARSAGTTVAEIRRLNPQLRLERTRNDRASAIRIPAGTRLAFHASPPPAAAARAPARPAARTAAAPAQRVVVHQVRRGETLGHIAQRHGTTVREIQRANGLRGDRIRAGASLRVPRRS
jgi:membrane-bound lytic murein transglycosylase D